MASDKKATTKEETVATNDWLSHAPKGYDNDTALEGGGLIPIYATGQAFDEKWPPVFGKNVCIYPLHFKNEKDADKQWRDFLLIKLDAPTFAMKGLAKDAVKCEMKVGDYILVPVNGSLETQKRLMIAAVDPNQVWTVGIGCMGWKDIGRAKGQEMMEMGSKVYETPAPVARTGEFRLLFDEQISRRVPALPIGGGVTHTGMVYDKDGVLQSAVGSAS